MAPDCILRSWGKRSWPCVEGRGAMRPRKTKKTMGKKTGLPNRKFGSPAFLWGKGKEK